MSKENRVIVHGVKGILSLYILSLLEKKEMYGQQLASFISHKRNMTKCLSSGTIYPVLKRLRQKGLIRYREEGRKRIYSLTEEAKKAIADAKQYLRNILEELMIEE